MTSEAERICMGVTGPLRGQAIELAENMLFLEKQLGIERKVISSNKLHTFVTETVGRGGDKHKVMRENKAVTGYMALLRSYTDVVSKLGQIIGQGSQTEQAPAAPQSNLERIRGKYGNLSMVSGGP